MPAKRRSARVAEKEASRKKAKVSTPTPDAQSPTDETPNNTALASEDASEDAPTGTSTSPSTPAFTSYEVPTKSKPIPCLRSNHPPGPTSPPISLIFTHGAGGGLSAPAMTNFCHGFASTGAAITCFQGSMNLKGRVGMFATVLEYERKNQASESERKSTSKSKSTTGLDVSKLAFGGRSMGARAAVLASHADQSHSIKLLVLVSYPLIGPSGDVRDQIILDLPPDTDILFISGDGDSMCDFDVLDKLRKKMKARSWMVVVKGADHGMNLKGGVKFKEATVEIGRETGRIAAEWIRERDENTTEMVLTWDADRGKAVGSWGDG